MRDSGHFCPYPRTYPGAIDLGLQATSGRGKSCLATEVVAVGGLFKLSSVSPIEAGAEAGLRPHHQGIQAPFCRRCTNDRCV